MDLTQSCQILEKTIWILVRLLWLFSQTPCIHLGIPRGGGSKLITFSHIYLLSQHPVDPNIACTDPEGGGARNPHGKTQVIWDYIGNKQLDPPPLEKVGSHPPPPPGKNVEAPLEPWKIIIFFEINHWHSVK